MLGHKPQKPIPPRVIASSFGNYSKHIMGALPRVVGGFALLFIGSIILMVAIFFLQVGSPLKGSLLLLLSWWVGWKEGWSKRISFFDEKFRKQIYRIPVSGSIKELKNTLKSRGVDAVASHPFPEHWKNQLMEHSPLYRRIPSELKGNLHQLTNVFLSKVEFRHGVIEAGQFGEDNMVLVAGEACVLITGRDYHDFRKLELVELRTNLLRNGLGQRFAGQASNTTVSLHWESVMDGITHGSSGYNVILHEFAHVMDFVDDGQAQGYLGKAGSQEARNWEVLLEEEFPKLVEAHTRGADYVIPYRGLERSRPEFFAWATEVFFERPVRLKRECPKVYEALKAFYNLDPVQWDNGEITSESPAV
tara:strand:- start:538 stop:1623 length:1086 start_codon:yes stop_codon:yes gene_type:complete